MIKKIKVLSLIAALMGVVSCSGNSTDNTGPQEGKGTISVTGAVEAEHEGISWFIGLRSGGDSYINLSLHVSDVGFAVQEENTYGLSIRMVGEDGPFMLSTGEYEIGHGSEGPLIIVEYIYNEGPARAGYGTSPDASGTVTIQSISDTSIEASFDVSLEAGPSTANSGFVNVTGNLTAKCAGIAGNSSCNN
jgi:hypothetical protein